MSVSIARKIAFDVLLRVATQDAYADEALRAARAETVSTEDAGLATELTFGTLRWQRLLDYRIDRCLAKTNKSLDAEVRIALRLGVYQLQFLTSIPARAAVHESVELIKLARKRSAAPLVNAVLRRAAKECSSTELPSDAVASLLPKDLPLAESMGIRYSHPTWLIERWLRTFGEERTHELLTANNRIPTMSAYVLDPRRSDEALSSLRQAGCQVMPGRLLRDSYTLQGGYPAASKAIRSGWIAIQDEASQAVARLMAVHPGNTVLDLCAAPGGKTLRMTLDAGPAGHIIAADLHAHRVRAMEERFGRSNIQNVKTIALDGTGPLPFPHPFNRILVDVPCSGTGTLARHPEIRWRLRPENIHELHRLQVALLRNALGHLAPGGRLVYSTCSLEPEENEIVVNEALGKSGNVAHIVDARETIGSYLQQSVSIGEVVCADGFFRTFPPQHRTDGFFAAIIERDPEGV